MDDPCPICAGKTWCCRPCCSDGMMGWFSSRLSLHSQYISTLLMTCSQSLLSGRMKDIFNIYYDIMGESCETWLIPATAKGLGLQQPNQALISVVVLGLLAHGSNLKPPVSAALIRLPPGGQSLSSLQSFATLSFTLIIPWSHSCPDGLILEDYRSLARHTVTLDSSFPFDVELCWWIQS